MDGIRFWLVFSTKSGFEAAHLVGNRGGECSGEHLRRRQAGVRGLVRLVQPYFSSFGAGDLSAGFLYVSAMTFGRRDAAIIRWPAGVRWIPSKTYFHGISSS